MTDKTATNNLFTNLKAYITEEIAHLNSQTEKLTKGENDDESTLQGKFKSNKEDLNDVDTEMDKYTSALSNTISVSKDTGLSWKSMEDCRNMRKVFLKFEEDSCYKYNYYLFIMMVLCCVACVVLLLLIWCLCCALRKTEHGDDDEPRRNAYPT